VRQQAAWNERCTRHGVETTSQQPLDRWLVQIPVRGATLEGELAIPAAARGLCVFAQGSGSARSRWIAQMLRDEIAVATLLVDLLSARELALDALTVELRFDVGLLAQRVGTLVAWSRSDDRTRGLPIALFGASTGAAAALVAAATAPDDVRAVVVRGGRPDLAADALARVQAPTLFVVGGNDATGVARSRRALAGMQGERRLEVVAGADPAFEEPGKLGEVVRLAAPFLARHLAHA
jgi:pimeloyl-ACP methyl ester carboxylesterase